MIDSHCHLENERFQDDVEPTLQRMKEAGVMQCILAGSDAETSQQIVSLTSTYDSIYGVVGIHPHEASTFHPSIFAQMDHWLSMPKILGVGEIGLDYYYDHSPREQQRDVLSAQLDYAYQKKVPAVFHVRDAHGDFIDVLRAHKSALPQGVMHCYAGSVESAKIYMDFGFMISFSGTVTFKNATNLQEVARFVPMDRMFIETDSPYLSPVPKRGQRNEPAYVVYVAQKIAELKGISTEEVESKTTANIKRFYSF